ncbi:MAG TPA: outer membrane protein assembly factor BamA, partial [Thermodesulfobacteriota bacterium]|nr:outer membrane protein assembly factor BamA [Thermodesulfobacteriota bacterium]
FYLSKGFLEVKVGKPRVDPGKKGLTISIPVDEGRQFRVGLVDVKGDLLFPKEELLKMLPLAVGEIFNREKVRQGVSNLSDKYADQGYAFVDVSPQTIPHPAAQLADLIIDIRQGSKVYFERVNISGNTKTRDRVIRRDVGAVEGELYSLSALKRTRESLNYLGYFKEVNVDTKKGSADDKLVVNVQVQEGPTGSISAGAGYSSIDKLVALLTVSQNNIFGLGQSVRASAQLGSISQYYMLSYTEPRLFDTRVLVGGDLYNNFRDYNDYTIRTTGGLGRVGYPLFERVRGFNQYKYETIDVFNVKSTASSLLQQQAGTTQTSSVSQGIRRDSRDHRFDPTRGSDIGFTFEFAGGPLGGTNDFTKYQLSSSYYVTPFWNTTFMARGRIDYINGYGGNPIPFYERFRLGGIYTLRGFKAYSVGPKTSTGETLGGDKDLLFNFEMIFPIAKEIKLKGVLFFDAGNAWDVGQNYNIGDLRTSAGFGLRWMSPVGPLRLEWGYNIAPKSGEAHSSWEFTIGGFF